MEKICFGLGPKIQSKPHECMMRRREKDNNAERGFFSAEEESKVAEETREETDKLNDGALTRTTRKQVLLLSNFK